MSVTRIVTWLLLALLLTGVDAGHAQPEAQMVESARFSLDVELEIRDPLTDDMARFYLAADGVYHLQTDEMGEAAGLLDWLAGALEAVRADVDVVTPGAGRPLPLNLPEDERAWQLRLVDGVGYARWLLPADSTAALWTGVDLREALPLLVAIPGLDALLDWLDGTPPPAALFDALGQTQRLPDVRLDRQKAAVFETTIDLGRVLADPDHRADVEALLFELARLAAVPRQYSTGGLLRAAGYFADALQTASVTVTQVIGLDDERLHHVVISAAFTPGTTRPVSLDAVRVNPDPLELAAVLPFDFRLNAALSLGSFDAVPAIDAPPDAILIPLPALLAPALRGAPL